MQTFPHGARKTLIRFSGSAEGQKKPAGGPSRTEAWLNSSTCPFQRMARANRYGSGIMAGWRGKNPGRLLRFGAYIRAFAVGVRWVSSTCTCTGSCDPKRIANRQAKLLDASPSERRRMLVHYAEPRYACRRIWQRARPSRYSAVAVIEIRPAANGVAEVAISGEVPKPTPACAMKLEIFA